MMALNEWYLCLVHKVATITFLSQKRKRKIGKGEGKRKKEEKEEEEEISNN